VVAAVVAAMTDNKSSICDASRAVGVVTCGGRAATERP
jgi:hypothetical protein